MKIGKTGQTRGAEQDEIYQNRVGRTSTVLIPHDQYANCAKPDDGSESYEKGFIVLVDPDWYFSDPNADQKLSAEGLTIGENALLYFQRQDQWESYSNRAKLDNGKPFAPATSRLSPLGGTYVARVHATTAHEASINHGYAEPSLRGAGIRVYEYASASNVAATKLQLEALVWLCVDSHEAVVAGGMSPEGARRRADAKLAEAEAAGLLAWDRLLQVRAINNDHQTICPLCLELVSAAGFMQRNEQAEGRETWDNKITPISLFHIEELRPGSLLHRPYNLGWGHHHCNVVVADKGIPYTLDWMKRVIENNGGTEAIVHETELIEKAVER
jgi:hypothetical protein